MLVSILSSSKMRGWGFHCINGVCRMIFITESVIAECTTNTMAYNRRIDLKIVLSPKIGRHIGTVSTVCLYILANDNSKCIRRSSLTYISTYRICCPFMCHKKLHTTRRGLFAQGPSTGPTVKSSKISYNV